MKEQVNLLYYIDNLLKHINLATPLLAVNLDVELDRYDIALKMSNCYGILKICGIGNPGWYLEHYFKSDMIDQYIGVNTGNDDDIQHWFQRFIATTKEYNNSAVPLEYNSSASPLYLSVILEGFRCYKLKKNFDVHDVESLHKMRQKLQPSNPILSWLEELYNHYCYWDDWGFGESSLGFDMISSCDGWVIIFSLEEVDLGDKKFDPIKEKWQNYEVNLFKKDDKLIIKAPYGTLEKALYLFKDWVEQ